MHFFGSKSRRARFNDNAGNFFAPFAFISRDALDGDATRDFGRRIGDKNFRSVDRPLAILKSGIGLRITRITAGIGFSQSKSPKLFSCTKRR